MEVITSTQNYLNYYNDLSQGEFHLVTFAEDGAGIFSSALEFAFHLDRDEIKKFSDLINQTDETGTLWPKAQVTAIPEKFCIEDLDDRNEFRRCIRDTFIANRDYWMARKMLFDFTGNVLNTEDLEDEITCFAMGEFNAFPLEEVEIRFDSQPGEF